MKNNIIYKGLEIREVKDCWGCNSFIVYKNNKQLSDSIDCITDAKDWINEYLGY